MNRHGIVTQYNIKHHDIVSFRTIYNVPKHYRDSFKKNYDLVWDIFNEVGLYHGFQLPKYFVCAEMLTRRYRYGKTRSNTYILEPMGPVIPVDSNYNILAALYMNENAGFALYSNNWYDQAERFFMVHGSANQALTSPRNQRIREGLVCKRWRAIDLNEIG
jgi:hypothetical protein